MKSRPSRGIAKSEELDLRAYLPSELWYEERLERELIGGPSRDNVGRVGVDGGPLTEFSATGIQVSDRKIGFADGLR